MKPRWSCADAVAVKTEHTGFFILLDSYNHVQIVRLDHYIHQILLGGLVCFINKP